jgi:hypothetical protein
MYEILSLYQKSLQICKLRRISPPTLFREKRNCWGVRDSALLGNNKHIKSFFLRNSIPASAEISNAEKLLRGGNESWNSPHSLEI